MASSAPTQSDKTSELQRLSEMIKPTAHEKETESRSGWRWGFRSSAPRGQAAGTVSRPHPSPGPVPGPHQPGMHIC